MKENDVSFSFIRSRAVALQEGSTMPTKTTSDPREKKREEEKLSPCGRVSGARRGSGSVAFSYSVLLKSSFTWIYSAFSYMQCY